MPYLPLVPLLVKQIDISFTRELCSKNFKSRMSVLLYVNENKSASSYTSLCKCLSCLLSSLQILVSTESSVSFLKRDLSGKTQRKRQETVIMSDTMLSLTEIRVGQDLLHSLRHETSRKGIFFSETFLFTHLRTYTFSSKVRRLESSGLFSLHYKTTKGKDDIAIHFENCFVTVALQRILSRMQLYWSCSDTRNRE